jgi:hypothetical protein
LNKRPEKTIYAYPTTATNSENIKVCPTMSTERRGEELRRGGERGEESSEEDRERRRRESKREEKREERAQADRLGGYVCCVGHHRSTESEGYGVSPCLVLMGCELTYQDYMIGQKCENRKKKVNIHRTSKLGWIFY